MKDLPEDFHAPRAQFDQAHVLPFDFTQGSRFATKLIDRSIGVQLQGLGIIEGILVTFTPIGFPFLVYCDREVGW